MDTFDMFDALESFDGIINISRFNDYQPIMNYNSERELNEPDNNPLGYS